MDFNIEVRKKQLQSLDQYITSSKDKVQSILEYLGWNAKRVLEKEDKVPCSINPNHQIPLKHAEEHLKKCYFKTSGYNPNENLLSEPKHHTTTSIKLDNAKKLEILGKARYNNQRFKAAWIGQEGDPMTSDRLFSTFSTDERLTLYEYCIEHTESPPIPSEFNIHFDDKKEEKLLTEEELLAKERDSKRRRAKYKSVHTSLNKSHTELMKEVIENQMDLYKEYLAKNTDSCTYSHTNEQQNDQNNQCSSNENTHKNGQNECKKSEDIERPHSSISHHSAHSSSSRSKRDYGGYKYDDDRKKNEEYNRNHDKRERSPFKDKWKKYADHKDSRDYSRNRRSRHYKSDHRH